MVVIDLFNSFKVDNVYLLWDCQMKAPLISEKIRETENMFWEC